MRAVDTNVLVRLITRDDEKQARLADAFVERGAWVSHLALAEAMWILEAVYGQDPAAIATAIEILLNHQTLTLQDADVVQTAVAQFRRKPSLGFSDCLMVETARKAGHTPLGTFDRVLARLPGAERL